MRRSGAESLRVPARYYARMGEMLQAHAIDIAAILQQAGLQPAQLQGDAALRQEQVEALVDAAFARSGRTDLGLLLGRSLKHSSHSIVGYAMLSSPTAGYALRLVARFFSLIMPSFRMRCRVTGEHMEIAYWPVVSMSRQCLSFHLEAIGAATHWEARDLVQGDLPRYDLYLSIPEPPHVAQYAAMHEARCHFGWDMQPGLRMVMPAKVANEPLVMADPASLQMAEKRCAQLVQKAVAEHNVADWVYMMIMEASDGVPTLEDLAHTLNLSARTLDRYLKKEGRGFRELTNQARFEKACRLLVDTSLTVTQIAFELGYSDAANFSRAFRQQAACAPSDYRQQHVVQLQ